MQVTKGAQGQVRQYKLFWFSFEKQSIDNRAEAKFRRWAWASESANALTLHTITGRSHVDLPAGCLSLIG